VKLTKGHIKDFGITDVLHSRKILASYVFELTLTVTRCFQWLHVVISLLPPENLCNCLQNLHLILSFLSPCLAYLSRYSATPGVRVESCCAELYFVLHFIRLGDLQEHK